MNINFIHLPEVDSTNTWLRDHVHGLPHATVVTATSQTAGRGQRGNTWESDPGANLTFSMLLRPDSFPAARQFNISEAVALGIVFALQSLLPHHSVTVKWPNDIYVGDRKICGILIENSLEGSLISHSIAGIGINVNQERFLSDAPNPISLYQLTGRKYLLQPLLRSASHNIITLLHYDREKLHSLYLHHLYARHGARYRDTATQRIFSATIHDIAPDGMLTLCDSTDSTLHTYAFKEVALILPNPI